MDLAQCVGMLLYLAFYISLPAEWHTPGSIGNNTNAMVEMDQSVHMQATRTLWIFVTVNGFIQIQRVRKCWFPFQKNQCQKWNLKFRKTSGKIDGNDFIFSI